MSYIDGLPTAPSVNDDDLLVIDQGGSGVPGSGTTYKTPVLSVRGTGGLVPITARSLLANSTGGNALPTATTLGTGLSFTGASLGLNGALPASTAIMQNGSTILNSYGAGLGDGTLMLIGKGAGASLPAGAVNMVAIGTNALGSDTGTNSENVAVGWGALRSVTTGLFNTAVGLNAGGLFVTDSGNTVIGCDAQRNAIGSNNSVLGSGLRDGSHDKATVIGHGALTAFNQTASVTSDNTAIGYNAMAGAAITTASGNTVIGSGAGQSLISGNSNVIMGQNAAPALTTGGTNIIAGPSAGLLLLSGSGNVFLGNGAGAAATTSSSSVAIGPAALSLATSSSAVGIGNQAGKNLTTGIATLVGPFAGFNTTTGSNVAIGNAALQGAAASTASLNTAIGDGSLIAVTSASQNTVLGRNGGNKITSGQSNVIMGPNVASTTLATGSSNIIIGVDSSADAAAAGTNDTVLIRGKASGTAAVLSATTTGGTPTTIMGGLLGTSATTGITAHAGGTQALATPLTTGGNLIATCATANDSVRLPVSTIPGIHIIITNNGAASAQLYGAGTDTINGVATATGVAIAPGKTWYGHAPAAGTWFGGTLT